MTGLRPAHSQSHDSTQHLQGGTAWAARGGGATQVSPTGADKEETAPVVEGMRKGARVAQGETVGFVGATGLATGPHLHYEFRINDVHQNPLRVALPAAPPIGPEQKPAFDAAAAPLAQRLALLRSTNIARLD